VPGEVQAETAGEIGERTGPDVNAPSQIVGHKPLLHAPGDWRCRCGLPLGASRREAYEVMPAHRAQARAARPVRISARRRRSYRDYRARRRQDADAAAVERWQNRTRNAALSRLAREYPARFLAILGEVREADPRPTAEAEEASRAA
jgi:hypothetical protein